MSSVTVSLDKLGKALENQIKKDMKQVRFAAYKTVDKMIQPIRKELKKEYLKSFHVRNKSLPNAVKFEKPTKENPVAVIFFDKKWMKLNTTGGTKTGDGKNLGFAGSVLDENHFRFPSGAVKEQNRPKEILKYADEHPTKSLGSGKRKKAPKAFKTVGKHGYKVIGIREKSTNKVQWIYSLHKTAKIEKKWDFEGIAKNFFEKNAGKMFDKELDKAMKTAK